MNKHSGQVLVSADAEGWTGIATSEDAEAEARTLYDDPDGTWAGCTIYRIPAHAMRDGWEGRHVGAILRDEQADVSDYMLSSWDGHIDAVEPDCDHADGHNWTATHAREGGIEGNPGVWGNGGGIITHEHCTRCTVTRKTDTWVTSPIDGSQGHTVVSYDTEEGY